MGQTTSCGHPGPTANEYYKTPHGRRCVKCYQRIERERQRRRQVRLQIEREMQAALEDTYADEGYVYLIGAPQDPSLVKVGFSTDPARRARQLQNGNGRRLRVIAKRPGTRADEKGLHAEFREHRTVGEWFKPTPALLAVFDIA